MNHLSNNVYEDLDGKFLALGKFVKVTDTGVL